jgi:hypothetical protein
MTASKSNGAAEAVRERGHQCQVRIRIVIILTLNASDSELQVTVSRKDEHEHLHSIEDSFQVTRMSSFSSDAVSVSKKPVAVRAVAKERAKTIQLPKFTTQ